MKLPWTCQECGRENYHYASCQCQQGRAVRDRDIERLCPEAMTEIKRLRAELELLRGSSKVDVAALHVLRAELALERERAEQAEKQAAILRVKLDALREGASQMPPAIGEPDWGNAVEGGPDVGAITIRKGEP